MSKQSKSFLFKTVHPLVSSIAIGATLVLTFVSFTSFSKGAPSISEIGSVAGASTGFDMYGYNETARIFVGKADGIDKVLDGKVWGDATYANDKLVMKWNSDWDRGNDEGWTDPAGYDAWEDNEWNGMVPGGSKETWHYKIVWDKGCKLNDTPSTTAVKGTVSCIWGQFAVVMSQGTAGGAHLWDVLSKSGGYGLSNK